MNIRQSMQECSMQQSSMHAFSLQSGSIQSCIETCTYCHQVCLQTAMNHCPNTGGKHVRTEHFRLMMNCAEICQMSANYLLGSSQFSHRLCPVCAELCEAYAADCKNIGGMDGCVDACKKCAESCLKMTSINA